MAKNESLAIERLTRNTLASYPHNDTQSSEVDLLNAYAYLEMSEQLEAVSETSYLVELEQEDKPFFLN